MLPGGHVGGHAVCLAGARAVCAPGRSLTSTPGVSRPLIGWRGSGPRGTGEVMPGPAAPDGSLFGWFSYGSAVSGEEVKYKVM